MFAAAKSLQPRNEAMGLFSSVFIWFFGVYNALVCATQAGAFCITKK